MEPTRSTQLHQVWKSGEMLLEHFPVDREPAAHPLQKAAWGGSHAGTFDALLARMKGPGGYYNIGNVLALTTGLGVQIAAVFRR